jgi:hypothetical protein
MNIFQKMGYADGSSNRRETTRHALCPLRLPAYPWRGRTFTNRPRRSGRPTELARAPGQGRTDSRRRGPCPRRPR